MTYANNINCQINTGEKQHAAMPKPQQQDNAAEGGKLAAVNAQDQRASGVNLRKDEKDNVTLEFDRDAVLLSASSVSLDSNKARTKINSFMDRISTVRENVDKFTQKTISRLAEAIEDAERNRYSPNRLVAKVAEFKIGILQQVLSKLGVSASELEDIRQTIRTEMVANNESGLVQTIHDATVGEITANG